VEAVEPPIFKLSKRRGVKGNCSTACPADISKSLGRCCTTVAERMTLPLRDDLYYKMVLCQAPSPRIQWQGLTRVGCSWTPPFPMPDMVLCRNHRGWRLRRWTRRRPARVRPTAPPITPPAMAPASQGIHKISFMVHLTFDAA